MMIAEEKEVVKLPAEWRGELPAQTKRLNSVSMAKSVYSRMKKKQRLMRISEKRRKERYAKMMVKERKTKKIEGSCYSCRKS